MSAPGNNAANSPPIVGHKTAFGTAGINSEDGARKQLASGSNICPAYHRNLIVQCQMRIILAAWDHCGLAPGTADISTCRFEPVESTSNAGSASPPTRPSAMWNVYSLSSRAIE